MGFRPIVLERGRDVRIAPPTLGPGGAKKILTPESNVQFGEGGAGLFSMESCTARSRIPSSMAAR